MRRSATVWRAFLALVLALGLFAGWLPLAPVARAAGLTVNSTLDVVNGIDGLCTLREAIIAVNTHTPSGVTAGECPAGDGANDTITLAAGATYTLTIPNPNPGTAETDATKGDLDITAPVAIVVAGGGTATIDANGGVTHDRAIEVNTLVGTVAITGVTIRNGQASMSSSLGGGSVIAGGAILLEGSGNLALANSTISGNTAGNGDPSMNGDPGAGGGIAHLGAGTLTVSGSTFTANSALVGVAILTGFAGPTVVVNSTFSGNTVNGYGGYVESAAVGGISGLSMSPNATTRVVNSTIANNTTGIGTLLPGSSVRHTIVAGNSTANCSVPAPEGAGDGYNVDSGTSCGFTSANGSLSSTDPLLRPLGSYGGPTQTQTLQVGSPARDLVPVANCTDNTGNALATDQRGTARPQGSACDSGATESVITPVPTGVNPAGGTTSGGTSIIITGSSFTPGSTVTVGGVACTGVAIAPTQITCTTGPNTAGAKDVVVANADGVGTTLTGAFTYRAPTITGVAPASGPVGGGTPITISGTDFVTGATATVGGRPCTAITVAATTITCTTPPGAPGPADVVVVNPNAPGTSGTAASAGAFTYMITQQANLDVAGLTFGPQEVNTTSTGQTVTLTNGGTAPLVVSAVAIAGADPGDFAITGAPCVTTLAAGASCTVTVTFTPTAPGSRGASLVFTDNSGGVAGSQQGVGLSGTGTAPAVAFGPTILPFPNQEIGTTSPPQT